MNATNIAELKSERSEAKTFPQMIEVFKKQIALALPRHMSADRMARVGLTCFRMNPLLRKCAPDSVFACIIQASQLGLEPGINGQAYLVPFWNNKKKSYECQLIPGYRGLIDLARRTAKVQSVSSHIVFEHDKYELVLGDEDHMTHKPKLDGDRGNPIFGYCVAKFGDGGKHIEPMIWNDIMAIKARTKSRNKKGEIVGPWITDEIEMARKTIVRKASKYWPMSVELQTAMSLDDSAATGTQDITIKDAIEGTWAPISQEEDIDDNPGEITQSEKPKRHRRTKAEMEAAKRVEAQQRQEANQDRSPDESTHDYSNDPIPGMEEHEGMDLE